MGAKSGGNLPGSAAGLAVVAARRTARALASGGWRCGCLLLALTVPLAPVSSAAADPTPPVLELSDAELAARLGFLQERLDAARPTALAWHWGWTGFYGASLAVNVGSAIEAEDGDDRVRAIVDATKSGVAIVQTMRLLRDPLPAIVGAQPMRAVPGDDRAGRLERLAVGERQLLASAARAETRYSLRRHLLVTGGNLLGGAAILALGDADDALQSTLIGTAIGEAQIWSQPWRASGDLRDYRAAFPDARGVGWEVRPKGSGAELVLRF
jgi:hypothetical protein